MRQAANSYGMRYTRSNLGAPYDDMVVRLHERVLELLVPAHQGNVPGVLVSLERLMKQASALQELLQKR